MKLPLILLLFLLPLAVRADQGRFQLVFTSANQKYELSWQGPMWSLKEKATGKELYKLEAGRILSLMTVLVSDDGKTVVGIDDYSTQDRNKDPEVLLFYKEGKKVRSYKLSEVLDNPQFVSVSVSHFRWVHVNGKTPGINDTKVSLTTYELYDYVFNAETGEVLKKERNEILSGGAVFVTGYVRGLGGRRHEIEVQCVIYGPVRKGDIVPFESDKIRWEGPRFYETLILKDGKLLAARGATFNVCR